MGVRFECPRGHPLHVKAHLAGKRGICPQCGARFVVPTFSGGRVAEATEPSTFGAGDASNHTPTHVDETLWYVRPAAGGQYGPVGSDVFQQWVREGRVAADSWVWRTGWADWKSGREALAAAAPVDVAPTAAADSGDDLFAPTSASRSLDDWPLPKPGESLSSARRRRQQLNHRLTLILGCVAVLLIVALAVVLSNA